MLSFLFALHALNGCCRDLYNALANKVENNIAARILTGNPLHCTFIICENEGTLWSWIAVRGYKQCVVLKLYVGWCGTTR